MITLVSILLWAFALLALVRLLRSARGIATPATARALALLALLAIPLLFRPHELLLSGQDPGVYLNSAGAFARHQNLFFHDDMLASVLRSQRPLFLFGHWGYGTTKDSCLDIKDFETARIGPRFPPLFPILISPLMRTGPPFLGLYIIPLFAIFTGLALAVLATRLLNRPWAGPLAFLFYAASPMVVWHARAPRPEIIASFFALTGFALCLHAWESRPWARWPDLLLGLLCVTLAPFFHITGWFMALGAATVMLAWLATGRTDGLLHPPIALLGLLAYLWQTLRIADQYHLHDHLAPILAHPLLLTTALLTLTALPMAICLLIRKKTGGAPATAPSSSLTTAHPILFATSFLALCTWLILRTAPPAQRTFTGDQYHYAHPVDLRLVPLYVSWPIAILALTGLLAMILSRRPNRSARLAFLAWTLPAALLIGNMPDFFMTRYMLTAIFPLLALGLATLVTTPRSRAATLAATALILALSLHNRLTLITTTEYRGFSRFLDSVAAPVRAEHGMLLAEYARLATPLEHLFGLPLLSLDNETRDDYTLALAGWEHLMTQRPAQPAFFLTPFPPPISERFTFTPVFSNTCTITRLTPARYRRPTTPQTGPLTLFLYQMSRTPPAPPALPYTRWPNASNMGLVRLSKPQPKKQFVSGTTLPAGKPTTVHLATPLVSHPGDTLVLFSYNSAFMSRVDRGLSCVTLLPQGLRPRSPAAQSWTPLGQGWSSLTIALSGTEPIAGLVLQSPTGGLVSDLWQISGSQATRVEPSHTDSPHQEVVALPARGVWPTARVLLPAPAPATTGLAALLVAPHGGPTPHAMPLSVTQADGQTVCQTAPGGAWSWVLHPLHPDPSGSALTWLALEPTAASPSEMDADPNLPMLHLAGIATLALPPNPP